MVDGGPIREGGSSTNNDPELHGAYGRSGPGGVGVLVISTR